MGKETIICIVIVIAIIIGNYSMQNYTKESVTELSNQLDDLKQEILKIGEKNTEQIKENIKQLQEEWETRHDKLAYFIEHDELEKVETNLIGLDSFMEMEQYPEAISELDKSVFLLRHIEDKYALDLENIF